MGEGGGSEDSASHVQLTVTMIRMFSNNLRDPV